MIAFIVDIVNFFTFNKVCCIADSNHGGKLFFNFLDIGVLSKDNPSFPLAVLPLAVLLLPIRDHHPFSMLLAIQPIADINPSVGLLNHSFPLPLIHIELADVFPSIPPFEHSLPMHFVLFPHTLVFSFIRPDVNAEAFNIVGFKFA